MVVDSYVDFNINRESPPIKTTFRRISNGFFEPFGISEQFLFKHNL